MAKKPSIREKRTAKILAGKGGKSVSAAMREAGYSPATAKDPQKLTRKKTWKELMDEYLPEDKLAKVHSQLLEAEETFAYKGKLHKKPDHAARNRALDMALKVRGSYAPEQTTIVMRKFGEMTDEELDAAVEEAERKLRKKD